MEDTLCGQRRHVQGESLADVEKEVFHQPAVPRPLPDNADICFLYATVEGKSILFLLFFWKIIYISMKYITNIQFFI